MSSPPQHTYLITGATRGTFHSHSTFSSPTNRPPSGIGHGLLAHYLSLPSTLLIAGVRDDSSSSTRALSSLPRGANSSLIVVKIDSLAADDDAQDAVHLLRTKHGVQRIDTVVANAGIMIDYDTMDKVKPAVLREMVEVHGMAALLLFQAVLPLLREAPCPKFVVIGSGLGSIAGMEKRPLTMGAYGASKAIAHYIVRKIHAENKS